MYMKILNKILYVKFNVLLIFKSLTCKDEDENEVEWN